MGNMDDWVRHESVPCRPVANAFGFVGFAMVVSAMFHHFVFPFINHYLTQHYTAAPADSPWWVAVGAGIALTVVLYDADDRGSTKRLRGGRLE